MAKLIPYQDRTLVQLTLGSMVLVMLWTCTTIHAQITEAQVIQLYSNRDLCGKQIGRPQDPSRYVVEVFCEDALGNYIGIVRKAHLGAPIDGGWTLTTRFWQEDTWSTDVWSIAWVDDGRSLLVSSSNIYGEGAIFLLDLQARSSRILFSGETSDSRIVTIDRVDESKREVFFEIERFVNEGDPIFLKRSVHY